MAPWPQAGGSGFGGGGPGLPSPPPDGWMDWMSLGLPQCREQHAGESLSVCVNVNVLSQTCSLVNLESQPGGVDWEPEGKGPGPAIS